MEKQTKHRILGTLVVIALVIILLPLFQSAKDLPSEKVIVKAPPFPNQSLDVEIASTSEPAVGINNPLTSKSNDAKSEDIKLKTDDLISVTRPSVINTPIPVTTEPTNVPPDKLNETLKIDLDNTTKSSEYNVNKQARLTNVVVSEPTKGTINKAANESLVKEIKKPTRVNRTKVRSAYSAQAHYDKDGLIKLKNQVWVIQIGSFKNKANALRLANQLRTNGYRAFIQQALGESTRVFVGPETQQADARKVAKQIENDMHIHGIVIRYKPLTL